MIDYNPKWGVWIVTYNGFTAYFDYESNAQDWLDEMKAKEERDKYISQERDIAFGQR